MNEIFVYVLSGIVAVTGVFISGGVLTFFLQRHYDKKEKAWIEMLGVFEILSDCTNSLFGLMGAEIRGEKEPIKWKDELDMKSVKVLDKLRESRFVPKKYVDEICKTLWLQPMQKHTNQDYEDACSKFCFVLKKYTGKITSKEENAEIKDAIREMTNKQPRRAFQYSKINEILNELTTRCNPRLSSILDRISLSNRIIRDMNFKDEVIQEAETKAENMFQRVVSFNCSKEHHWRNDVETAVELDELLVHINDEYPNTKAAEKAKILLKEVRDFCQDKRLSTFDGNGA